MRLQGSLIVVAFSHVLQYGLPSIHRVVTEQALVDESISVLPLDVAPYICGILGLVATEFANHNFFAFLVKSRSHEGLYLLKNS